MKRKISGEKITNFFRLHGKIRRIDSLKVRVKFFAVCRDLAGTDSIMLELPDGAGEEDFWDVIITKYPKLKPYKALSRLAVNLEYVNHHVILKEGDEVCIIPPVSGG